MRVSRWIYHLFGSLEKPLSGDASQIFSLYSYFKHTCNVYKVWTLMAPDEGEKNNVKFFQEIFFEVRQEPFGITTVYRCTVVLYLHKQGAIEEVAYRYLWIDQRKLPRLIMYKNFSFMPKALEFRPFMSREPAVFLWYIIAKFTAYFVPAFFKSLLVLLIFRLLVMFLTIWLTWLPVAVKPLFALTAETHVVIYAIGFAVTSGCTHVACWIFGSWSWIYSKKKKMFRYYTMPKWHTKW